MNKHTDLNYYYEVLGADRNSSQFDLRHFRNKRLLEINHPQKTLDWEEADKKTKAVQAAYWLLSQKAG